MTLPAGYFDAMYARDPDPWRFATRWYEERKRALTLAALPARRYRRAFEPGCSIGLLSRGLAERCGSLLAADVNESALAAARSRLAGLPGIEVRRLAVPAEWPAGRFDLLVVSELGYYLDAADLDRLADRLLSALEPGGTLLAAHWRHPVADHPTAGDAVHVRLERLAGLRRLVRHEEEDFRLDVWLRAPAGTPGLSVAAREGLPGAG